MNTPARLTIPSVFPLANPDASFTLAVVYNPLDPTDRGIYQVAWKPVPVAQLLEGAPDEIEWVVSVNGKVIELEARGSTWIQPDDTLVLFPVPKGGGGGGGKGILRMIAMIVVMVVAAYVTGGAAAGMMGPGTLAAGSASAAIAGAAVAVGGAMLVNAMLPIPTPTVNPGTTGNDVADSPSYGIDGAKNTSAENTPVPIVFGQFRVAGNVANLRVDNAGASQYLYVQTNLSEGPIDSISDILINDQPLTAYTSVNVDQRLGTDNQAPPAWFAETTRTVAVSRKLLVNASLTLTTETEVDKFRLDFLMPIGLCSFDDKAKRIPASLGVRCEFRAAGTSDPWITILDQGDPYGATAPLPPSHHDGLGVDAALLGLWQQQMVTWQAINPNLPGQITFTDSSRNPVRRSIVSPLLAFQKYEIRFTRTTTPPADEKTLDDLYIDVIDEIVTEQVAYNFTAWLALQILFTDQLNNRPTVTALVKGVILDEYDVKGALTATRWSANPAWIALWVLTNDRCGGGIPLSRIDFPKWVEWAQYCDQEGLAFNGIFDTASNIWDALQQIFRVGHAQIVQMGTRYSVAMEKADIPVMMFGVGNIVQDSFTIDWLPLSDRANEVEVNYFDKNDGNRQHMVRAVDWDSLARGEPQRTATFTLPGVDNAQRAAIEAGFQIAMNKFILQTVSFDAPIEAIACLPGDLVYVQHDMPEWGEAGRLEKGSVASTVNLDREVTMAPGRDYRLLVVHAALLRSSHTAAIVAGRSVFVAGLVNDGLRRTRLKSGALDFQIVAVNYASPYTELVLERPAELAVGAALELWDTDVIEERQVLVTHDGTTSTITVAAPFSQPPAAYSNFMFGEALKVKKPFRVKSIAGSQEYNRTISAFEYNESVFADPLNAVATPNYSALPTVIGQVSILGVSEELVRIGTVIKTEVTVDWTPPAQLYAGADVYVAVNGRAYQMRGTVRNGAGFTFDAAEGDQLAVKVVAFDAAGRRANFNKAQVWTYSVLGKNAPPADVTGLAVRKSVGGVLLTWDANVEPDILGYEVRAGIDWDTSDLLVTNFAGNRFLVEKNTSGSRSYLVRAIDTTGHYSVDPAAVTLTLAGPAAVRGFNAVQNGTSIIFTWVSNTEPDIAQYEVREGINWASSQLVARVTANYLTVAADVPGTRIFWVKAIDSANIYSDTAVFAEPLVAEVPNRNVVYTQDDHANLYPGFRAGMSPVSGDLALDPGRGYGEYVTTIDLGASLMARTTVQDSFDAIQADALTWAAATFPWTAQDAQRTWIHEGDLESVVVEKQFSTFLGADAADVEDWSFSGTLAGLNGTAPSTAIGVGYAPGKFGQGVFIGEATHLEYTGLAIPAVFSITLGLRPQLLGQSILLMTLTGAGQTQLQLRYDLAADSFALVGNDGVLVVAPNFGFHVDDRLVVGIAQTATTRKLYVGRVGDQAQTSGSATASPVGALNTLTF